MPFAAYYNYIHTVNEGTFLPVELLVTPRLSLRSNQADGSGGKDRISDAADFDLGRVVCLNNGCGWCKRKNIGYDVL